MRPWAFKIDYAKNIAQDERELALLTEGLFATVCPILSPHDLEVIVAGDYFGVEEWVFNGPDYIARGALLGLSAQEVYDLAAFVADGGMRGYPHMDQAADHETADWARGREVSRWIQAFEYERRLFSESDRRRLATKTRTRLSRHRRNSDKWSAINNRTGRHD